MAAGGQRYAGRRRLSYTANLFYKRQSYNLALHNYSGAEDYEVPFEGGIDAYIREATGNEAGIPPYPATLEKDAYTFGGWYTSPGCYDGSEYVPGSTMPAAHLVLYAKWAPVQHDVRFFRTYDDMLAYEAGDTSVEVLHDLKVDHGALAEGVVTPEDTSGHDYVFGGWFYMKSHKKTAYTPLDMPIVRNMNVFADWGTHSAQPFIIHYVTLEAETDAAWTAGGPGPPRCTTPGTTRPIRPAAAARRGATSIWRRTAGSTGRWPTIPSAMRSRGLPGRLSPRRARPLASCTTTTTEGTIPHWPATPPPSSTRTTRAIPRRTCSRSPTFTRRISATPWSTGTSATTGSSRTRPAAAPWKRPRR